MNNKIAQAVQERHLTISELLVTADLGGVNYPHITDEETGQAICPRSPRQQEMGAPLSQSVCIFNPSSEHR